MPSKLPGPLRLSPSLPFAGRSRELALLRALIPYSETESVRFALVGGEAGSGKSRLVREFAHEAAAAGALVLYGACDAVVQRPYRPFVEALEQLARTTDPATLRADLGAAGGELGSAIREHFDRTIGFEYNVDCICDLRGRFDQVVIADLERVSALPSNVDVIVIADVLEHLRDPGSLLRLVRQSLSQNGKAFISVPNIANITIRLGLLFGIFEYRDRGILDHTHLHFYTMRTFRQEIEDAGFRIVEVRGSSVPIRLIVGKYVPDFILRPCERLLTWITRLWRSLFAYQIIVVAEPTSSRA